MALRNLNFTLQGDRYVAEETVNADYALHLERKAGGGFYILQRSSDDGMFVSCPLPAGLYNPGQFIDWCFGHGVYPMHIRIESMTEVTKGLSGRRNDGEDELFTVEYDGAGYSPRQFFRYHGVRGFV